MIETVKKVSISQLKIIKSEECSSNENLITDRYYLMHIFCFMLGILRILPQNFFVTANDYWMYKFRNISSNQTDSDSRTYLQVEFSTSMLISLHTSNVTFLLLTTLYGYKFRLNFRMIGSIIAMLLIFGGSVVFIKIDTDSWQLEFFIVTMLLIAAVNAANAILGISIYAMISNFPHVYMKTFLIGQGIADIFTSILQILSLSVGFETEDSAIVYFGLGIIAITFGLFMTIAVKYTNYYQFYMKRYHEGEQEPIMSLRDAKTISKKIWTILLAELFLILTMYPLHTSVTALIVSEGEGNGVWNDVYFVPTITFLLQGLCSCFGKLLAAVCKKNVNGKSLVYFCLVRMIIIFPLIMLCNARPRCNLPIVFPHDYQYILIIAAYGLTSGYIGVVCFLNIPQLVTKEELQHGYSLLLNITSVLMGITSFLGFLTIKML